MTFTVHQTIEKRGTERDRLGVFPVESRAYRESYAGTGYYFWHDSLDLAHWWGNVRYLGVGLEYSILEAQLHTKTEVFDLVGNPQHHRLIKRYQKDRRMQGATLGTLLNFLIGLDELSQQDIFPYRVIKLVDNLRDNTWDGEMIKLGENHGGMDLSPMLIICVKDLELVSLNKRKVVF